MWPTKTDGAGTEMNNGCSQQGQGLIRKMYYVVVDVSFSYEDDVRYGVIKVHVSAKGMRGTCIEGDGLFSPLAACRKSSKIGIGKPVGTVVFADISEV